MLDLFRAKLLGIEPEKFKDFQTLIRGYQLPKGGHHSTIVGSPTSWSWGRAGLSELQFTADKLPKGAGADADPTEIDAHEDFIHNKIRIPIWWHGLETALSGGTATQSSTHLLITSGDTDGNHGGAYANPGPVALLEDILNKNPTYEAVIYLSKIGRAHV